MATYVYSRTSGTTTTSPTKTATTTTKTTRSGTSGSSVSNGGKTSDKPQVAALEKLLASGFKAALDQRLANIQTSYRQGDKLLLQGYDQRADTLKKQRADNEKAEGDASFANLRNLARENADLLSEAASLGAGETDTLRAQLMAARNWNANQSEVNRSYFDTVRSNNSAVVDLNVDTRNARFNLANQMLSDQEHAWANYENQRADAATQLGNIQGNPYSDAYASGGKSAWDKMTAAATTVWENPGVSSEIRNWQGSLQPREEKLNNSTPTPNIGMIPKTKKPEGATLQGW